MPPPYDQPYHYFRQDATEFIHQNLIAWKPNQTSKTISTIWAGDPAVRAHYAFSAGTNPGPGLPRPEPIPTKPYTETNLKSVRKGNPLPSRTFVNAAPGNAALGDDAEGDDAPRDDALGDGAELEGDHQRPEGAGTIENGPDARNADHHVLPERLDPPMPPVVVSSVDKMPYDFWPQLPWSFEPDLPILDRETSRNLKHVDVWLQTKPHQSTADESTWHGLELLGVGGFGAAGLWVEMDGANNIIDKMVVKDVKPCNNHVWRDPRHWRNRLPREIAIHQLIEERRIAEPDMCRHLIGSRGYRLLMAHRRYRLYLDHYETAVYDAFLIHRNAVKAQLPEALLWYILRALSLACLLLQRGTTAEEPLENWKPITHLDITLTNVFLGLSKRKRDAKSEDAGPTKGKLALPRKRQKTLEFTQSDEIASDSNEDRDKSEEWSTENWKDLPLLPVLADFGNAFYSLGDGTCPLSDNPEDHLLSYPCTRYAPEHQRQQGPPWILLGEKTDVWGIGLCSWMLVTHRLPHNGPLREDLPAGTEVPLCSHTDILSKLPHDISTVLSGQVFPASNDYSQELKDLVRSCLEWDQDERPTLRHIVDTAERELRKPGRKEALMDWRGFRFDWPNGVGEFEIGNPIPQRYLYPPTDDPNAH